MKISNYFPVKKNGILMGNKDTPRYIPLQARFEQGGVFLCAVGHEAVDPKQRYLLKPDIRMRIIT